MADELELSGGGVIGVASSELYAHAAIHATLAGVLEELRVALNQVDRRVSRSAIRLVDAPVSALDAEHAIADATSCLTNAHAIAAGVPKLLYAAATKYEVEERVRSGLLDLVGDNVAWVLGAGLKLVGPLAFIAVAAPALVPLLATITALSGGKPLEWLNAHPEFYTSWAPALTGALGEHADEALMGALGLPVWLSPLLGTAGMTKFITRVHPGGALMETPVRVARTVELDPPRPPGGLADALERTQTKEGDGAQVRVELFTMPDGSEVANVYVDGTEDWSPWSSDEPWDMTSNFGGVAQNDYIGAVEGVKQAMRDAGITADTPVQLFGYSQGGIHAAIVTHQQEFNVVNLVTVASPVGGIALPESVEGMSIGHEEDLVVALDPDPVNDQILQVTTARFDGQPLPTGENAKAPGHQFDPYRQTFARLDDDRAPQVRAQIDRFVDRTAGAVSSTATEYVIERVPAEPD